MLTRGLTVTPEHEYLRLDIMPSGRCRHWARTVDPTFVRLNGRLYKVEAPFAYDGSSIPPLAWWTLATPLEWPWCYAGAIHDAAYAGALVRVAAANGYMFPVWFAPVDAHGVFFGILRACGVSSTKAFRAWAGVSIYGALRGHRRSYVPRDAMAAQFEHLETFRRAA